MRAMILAAGSGKRMGELTQYTPKALLRVAGHYLIEYSIAQLVTAGIRDIIINISWQAAQIQAALGDGKRYGANLVYSLEPERLETGGGILQALPFFANDPFIVISSDIITDYPLTQLLTQQHVLQLAHLIMVNNPAYHPTGDFALQQNKIILAGTPTFTFANIGLYHPALFTGRQAGHFRLAELLIPAITAGKVTGEHYQGTWYNVGTPQDLAEVNKRAREDLNLRPLASETNTLSN